jgi:hypothetical protein
MLPPPSIEAMEKVDLGALAEDGPTEGIAPSPGEDAMSGDGGGALAVVSHDGTLYRVMPSNSVSRDTGLLYETATSVVGPYRILVTETGAGRVVEVEKTR